MHFTSFETSMENLLHSFEPSNSYENVFLSDALNRILAIDIIAQYNSPEFPTSAMDGYAVKYEDQMNESIMIIDQLPAGTFAENEVTKGTCIKTFTGSLMSKGSDTLIPIENVEVNGNKIIIKESVPKGFSVRPIGENFQKGEILLKKGTKIDYAEIGVLASLNIAQVTVYKKPSVAIIATGSEILDVGEQQTNPSQIRSSNHFTIEALAKKYGANTTRMPIAEDNKEAIKTLIVNSLQDHDIVVTTGGVSVGDYDFVKEILKGMEIEYIINGVTIKPGQHIKVVKTGKKYIFALPGFPYSSTVTFILYVIPLIKQLQGLEPALKTIQAELNEDYRKKSKKTEFALGNLSFRDGKFFIDFKGKRSGSSAILTNMLGNTALIHLNKESGDLYQGDSVNVLDIQNL